MNKINRRKFLKMISNVLLLFGFQIEKPANAEDMWELGAKFTFPAVPDDWDII